MNHNSEKMDDEKIPNPDFKTTVEDWVDEDGDNANENGEEMALLAEILQGFTSKDPEERQKAALKAEALMKEDEQLQFQLEKERCNQERKVDENGQTNVEIVDFLQDLSLDEFKARKKTREQRKRNSDALRKQGNLCCAQHDYKEAVDFYSRAIDLIRDSSCLYTNRAFAYTELGMYQQALEDCEKAIFISEFSLKARLYKAKILRLMEKNPECLKCLEDARKCLPAYQPAIDDCEKNLFGCPDVQASSGEHGSENGGKGDKSKDDVFTTEKYMRLASNFQVEEMKSFFDK